MVKKKNIVDSSSSDQWIDVSVSLHSDMVHWPGDPPVRIERVHDMDHGDGNNVSIISMGSHTGTHVDAPLHFVRQGRGVDEIPLDTAIGPVRVIEIQDRESVKPEELAQHGILPGERILFKTINSSRGWESDAFIEDFVFISQEAASFLVESGVIVVGNDYLSVGGYKRDGSQVHRLLLAGGIWIIEGLNLSRVSAGKYDMICLPLKLEGGDGGPARVILKPVL